MKILKFFSPTCGPCKALNPIIEGVGQELHLLVEGVDVTQEPELAAEYGIRAVPTLVLVGDGNEHLSSKTGLMTSEAMTTWLGEYL